MSYVDLSAWLQVTILFYLDNETVIDKVIEIYKLYFTGDSSSYLLRRTLTNLTDMQKLPDEDFPFRKQVMSS